MKSKKLITYSPQWALIFLILSFLSGPTLASSSSDFCQIAELTGGACVTLPKPEEGDDDPTVWCTAFNIMMGTLRPTITGITPLKIPQDSTMELLMTAPNANFQASKSTVRIEGSNIKINEITVLSPVQMKVNVTVPPTEVLQFYDVFVETQLGTEMETAEGRCALEVIEKSDDVEILSISPGKVAQGTQVEMDIYANNIDFTAGTPVVDFGEASITTDQLNVHNSTHLTATVNVEQNTPTGFYHVTVTADGEVAKDVQPGGALLVLSSAFQIPSITKITPNQGQKGKTLENIEILGDNTHFNASSTVHFSGEGVTATSVENKSTTQILATVAIADNAKFGYRDVFVTTSEEVATGLRLFNIQLNEAPTAIELSNDTITISQEQPEKVIGTFITTDSDDNVHNYELVNNAGGRFQVLGNELQIADNTLLTANNQVSHTISVKSTDQGGESTSLDFTIKLNYAPTDITLSNTIVAERNGEGVIGALSTIDPNLPNDSHSYSLADNPGGLFKLENNQIRVANADLLVKGDYPIQIKVTDSTGLPFEKAFTIKVTDNPTPIGITLSNTIAVLNTPSGTTIGEFTTVDPSPNDSHTYDFVDNANGRFKIEGNQLITNEMLSELAQYEITVRSTDKDNLKVEENFTILVKELTLSKITILAQSKIGTEIGQFKTQVSYGPQAHTYTLLDSQDGRFLLDKDRLLVADENLEAGDYTITVRATDQNEGLSFKQDFTITVTLRTVDTDEEPKPDDETPKPDDGTDDNLVSTNPNDDSGDTNAQIDPPKSGAGNTTSDNNSSTNTRVTDSNTNSLTSENNSVSSGDDGETPTNGGQQNNFASLQFADDIVVVDEYAILSTTLPSVGEVLGYLVEIPITRTETSQGQVTVNYAVKDAQPGVDFSYMTAKHSLQWADGDNEPKTINLFVVKQDEQTRWLNVHLFEPKGKALLGTPSETWLIKQGQTCQTEPTLFLQPPEQEITLTVGEGPKHLTFIGGQLEGFGLIQTPDREIVNFEKPLFKASGPFLTLTPVQAGQTYFVLGDCASLALVHITVEDSTEIENIPDFCLNDDPELALRSEEPEIVLEIGQEPTLFDILGGQGDLKLTSPPDNLVAGQLFFTEEGDSFLELTPQQAGQTTFMVRDECGSEAEIQVTVASQCDLLESSEEKLEIEATNLTLIVGDEPSILSIKGGQGDLEFIQNNGLVSATRLFSETGDQVLMLTPEAPGKTQFTINDCFTQHEITITVLPEPPNAMGVDATGELIETKSYFKVTLSKFAGSNSEELWIGPTETLNLGLEIFVQPAHIGQAASLLILMLHETSGQVFVYNHTESWQLWNGELTNLGMFKPLDELPGELKLNMTLKLETLPLYEGRLSVYVGYRLGNGTIIFNGENPPSFNIANGIGFDTTGNPINTNTHFAGELSTNTGQIGKDLVIDSTTNTISVHYEIRVDEAHLGQPASIIIVAEHPVLGRFSLHEDLNWHRWDSIKLETLQSFEYIDSLPKILPIRQTLVSALPPNHEAVIGEWTIYIGYRLEIEAETPEIETAFEEFEADNEEAFVSKTEARESNDFESLLLETSNETSSLRLKTGLEGAIIFNGLNPLRLSIQD